MVRSDHSIYGFSRAFRDGRKLTHKLRSPVFRLLWLAIAVTASTTQSAFAWNKPGHMVTGAIAYDILKHDHPEVIPRVLDLLKSHPQYADVLVKRIEAVPAENRDRYAFMIMARWADDVRDQRQYHHGSWHYINLSVVAPADEQALQPPTPDDDNIVAAIALNTDTIRSDSSPADKAIALCWIAHLVGDIHQPLHAAQFFNRKQWPRGDKGGNNFYVRVHANRAIVNLHSLWDGLILGGQSYQAVSNMAVELRNRPEFARDELKELPITEPATWAEESRTLAAEVAYQKGNLIGGNDRNNGPLLPAGYTDAAKAAAERRIVVAGYRLAAMLLVIQQ